MLPAGMQTVHFLDHVFRQEQMDMANHSVLRTLDLDGNGYLDFKENMMAMDLVNANTAEEKLKWAFKM
jgi:Ca2+-binding EF-hand superfamily protein